MTLHDLENAVLDHFNYPVDDGNFTVRQRIRRHLNEWHRRILTTPGLDRLREDTISLTTVASQAPYAFGAAVVRLLRVRDTANRQNLTLENVEWYRAMEPDPTTVTGTPTACVLVGRSAIATKPATTVLYVVSSAAGDTAVKVTVDAINTTGNTVSAEVTLSGTTRVAVQTAASYIDVTRFVLSSRATGIVSLYDAATAGNLLGQIPAGQTSARYTRVAFWPTPSAALAYRLDYEQELAEMALANDEPLLPVDFHYLLELGARINEYEKQQDSRQAKAEAHLAEGLRRLMGFVMGDPGRVYVPGELSGGLSQSRLGPWFPRGS